MMKFFNQAKKYPLRTAVISEGTAYTYSELISQATAVAQYLLQGRVDLKSERIAFLAPLVLNTLHCFWEFGEQGVLRFLYAKSIPCL